VAYFMWHVSYITSFVYIEYKKSSYILALYNLVYPVMQLKSYIWQGLVVYLNLSTAIKQIAKLLLLAAFTLYNLAGLKYKYQVKYLIFALL